MKNILYAIKKFFYHIDNLIYWFPVIWNQQEWDHTYFYKLLKKKLERMEKFFRSKQSQGLYSYKDADNIKYCIDRLNRLLDSNYNTEAMIPFYDKFPDYNWGRKHEWVDIESGLVEWISKDTPEESEFMHECYKKAEEMEENDLDELFAQLRIHIQDWWD